VQAERRDVTSQQQRELALSLSASPARSLVEIDTCRSKRASKATNYNVRRFLPLAPTFWRVSCRGAPIRRRIHPVYGRGVVSVLDGLSPGEKQLAEGA